MGPCTRIRGLVVDRRTTSGCFPVEGTIAVGELIPHCTNVAFEGANHWLYLERPTLFNEIVATFVAVDHRQQ